MDPTYPLYAHHSFHFFGGLLMLVLGIFIGKALAHRRMRRFMRMGGDPGACGGCHGSMHRRCATPRDQADAVVPTASDTTRQGPREGDASAGTQA